MSAKFYETLLAFWNLFPATFFFSFSEMWEKGCDMLETETEAWQVGPIENWEYY